MLEIITDKERDLTAENEVLRAKIDNVQKWAKFLMEDSLKSEYAIGYAVAAALLK